MLGLACGGSSTNQMTPTTGPAVAARSMAGECVDPAADAATRLGAVDDAGDPPQQEATPDLDGDGVADRVYTAGPGVTAHGALYVMRGACGHFVGDVGGAPSATTSRTNDLLDLEVTDSAFCEGARCGCVPGVNVFRFNGTTYESDVAASRQGAEQACPE